MERKPSVRRIVRGHETPLRHHKTIRAEDLFPGPLFIWNPSENYLSLSTIKATNTTRTRNELPMISGNHGIIAHLLSNL